VILIFLDLVVIAYYERGAMEALKLEKKLDSSDSQNAIAISAGRKDYSYGHLLQSAFRISRLLRNGKGDTSSKTSGAATSNKVKGPECSQLFPKCVHQTLKIAAF
jgi:hypothetical protein